MKVKLSPEQRDLAIVTLRNVHAFELVGLTTNERARYFMAAREILKSEKTVRDVVLVRALAVLPVGSFGHEPADEDLFLHVLKLTQSHREMLCCH